MGWIKKTLVNILVVGVSIAVALVCADMLLRLTSYSKLLPYSGIPRYYYEPSRQSGYDISKNFATSTHRFADGSYEIWSNNLGCYDMPYGGEQPFIYLGGDSFTWGFTPYAEKWGTKLQESLGVRVVKCGVPGSGTKQQLQKAQKVLEQTGKPSLILLGYFSNDPHDDAAFPNSLVYEGQLIKNLSNEPGLSYDELEKRLPQYAQWAQEYCMWNMPAHPWLQRTKCYLRNHSILYLLAQSSIKTIIPKSALQAVGLVNQEPVTPQASDDTHDEHLAHLLAFKSLATKERAAFLVVLIPPKEDVYSTATSTTYVQEKEYMRQHGIAYVDPLEGFRDAAHATSASFYWPVDPHLNPAGNQVLGELVADYLKSHPAITTGR